MKLSAQAREEVRRQVREHPDVLDLLPSLTAVSKLSKQQLLEAADDLGIDVEAIVKAQPGHLAPSASKSRAERSDGYAFEGSVEFDISMQMLGISIERKARAVYAITPEWPFVDVITGETQQRLYSSRIGIEALSVPWEEHTETLTDGQRQRVKEPGEWGTFASGEILSEAIWDKIDELIDQKIRAENEERRTKLALPAPSVPLSNKSV